MEEFTVLSLVQRLLGGIESIGETNYDDKVFENIQNYEELLSDLIFPIIDVARGHKTGRFSEDRQTEKAISILKSIRDNIDEWLLGIEESKNVCK